MNSTPKLDILKFIQELTYDNAADKLKEVLISPSGDENTCVREYLIKANAIIDNDYFSVSSFPLEHVETRTYKGVKVEALSIFFVALCVRVKQGSLFTNNGEAVNKLLKLSMFCINLQPAWSGGCNEDNLTAFITNKDDGKDTANPIHFTLTVFQQKGSVH